MNSFERILGRTLLRLHALIDGSAWLLILPAALGLFSLDAPMVKSLAQWSLYFVVLAGLAVMISRIVFPTIRLRDLVDRAETDPRAAGLVAAAVIAFVAILILSFVLWARPAG